MVNIPIFSRRMAAQELVLPPANSLYGTYTETVSMNLKVIGGAAAPLPPSDSSFPIVSTGALVLYPFYPGLLVIGQVVCAVTSLPNSTVSYSSYTNQYTLFNEYIITGPDKLALEFEVSSEQMVRYGSSPYVASIVGYFDELQNSNGRDVAFFYIEVTCNTDAQLSQDCVCSLIVGVQFCSYDATILLSTPSLTSPTTKSQTVMCGPFFRSRASDLYDLVPHGGGHFDSEMIGTDEFIVAYITTETKPISGIFIVGGEYFSSLQQANSVVGASALTPSVSILVIGGPLEGETSYVVNAMLFDTREEGEIYLGLSPGQIENQVIEVVGATLITYTYVSSSSPGPSGSVNIYGSSGSPDPMGVAIQLISNTEGGAVISDVKLIVTYEDLSDTISIYPNRTINDVDPFGVAQITSFNGLNGSPVLSEEYGVFSQVPFNPPVSRSSDQLLAKNAKDSGLKFAAAAGNIQVFNPGFSFPGPIYEALPVPSFESTVYLTPGEIGPSFGESSYSVYYIGNSAYWNGGFDSLGNSDVPSIAYFYFEVISTPFHWNSPQYYLFPPPSYITRVTYGTWGLWGFIEPQILMPEGYNIPLIQTNTLHQGYAEPAPTFDQMSFRDYSLAPYIIDINSNDGSVIGFFGAPPFRWNVGPFYKACGAPFSPRQISNLTAVVSVSGPGDVGPPRDPDMLFSVKCICVKSIPNYTYGQAFFDPDLDVLT